MQQLQLTAKRKLKFEIESHEPATQWFFCFDTGALCDFAQNKILAAKVKKNAYTVM